MCFYAVSNPSRWLPSKTVSASIPLSKKTQKLLESYPIEKVHMHFDKPYYAVGDTMWFKVYLTSNMYNYELSKVAYVDVLNGKDSLMQTMRIPLTDRVGDGHLVLDQEWYTQGNYRFRARVRVTGIWNPCRVSTATA